MAAPSPIFSIISEKPGPDVIVIAFLPDHEAPSTAAMEPSSSSIWTKIAPTSGALFANASAASVEGVIG